jgi:hypothetical protein
LRAYYRDGLTFREIGAVEFGITGARVQQIHARAIRLLRASLQREASPPEPPRKPLRRSWYFDKAAFLDHMRGLIAKRDVEHLARIEASRDELHRLMQRERMELPSEAFKQAVQAIHATIPVPIPHHYDASQPPPKPSVYDQPVAYHFPKLNELSLRRVADLALAQYMTYRMPVRLGILELGLHCTSCTFPHHGHSVVTAMRQLIDAIPADALISAAPFEVPQGYVGLIVGNEFVSIRALLGNNGADVRLDVTWSRYE